MGPVLAIDQGTTSTRGFLVEEDGTMRLVGQHHHRTILPRPGWVEHDPCELLQAITNLIARAGPVSGIGIANQGETVVAWNGRTKQPLYNAIVWQDTRTQETVDRLRAEGAEGLVRQRSGLPLDPYFSATKLRWLLDHVTGARGLLRDGLLCLGTTDAFFLHALTGQCATDPSTASRTSLLDIARIRWDEELCALFGVPAECLPSITDTTGAFGAVPDGTPVIASLVDQQAALHGHCCRIPGDLKITFGTGAFALAITEALSLEQGPLLPTCAWSIRGKVTYALDGGIATAGSAVEWLRQIRLLDSLDALAAYKGPSAAEQGVFFVPAQIGLGCPHWDRGARALWIGIGLDTTRETLCRAVLEGIAFRARELVDAFAVQTGSVRRISVDGGLSRSPTFTSFLADALGRPFDLCVEPDITARGVAALCRNDVAFTPPRTRRIEPHRALSEHMHVRFRRALERARSWVEE
jgi:glycerol kinase